MSNMGRNISVARAPAKGGERNVEGVSPFRGNPDVAPMPRFSVAVLGDDEFERRRHKLRHADDERKVVG